MRRDDLVSMSPRRMAQRIYQDFFMDSTSWDRYRPRPGDIVISTAPKAGTTWTQRVVSVLVLQGTRLPGPLREISPWLESRISPLEEKLEELDGQRHRRFIKTHLPMEALPVYSEVSYIVVGRDLRDTAVSAHNHLVGMARMIEAAKPSQSAAGGDGTAGGHRFPEVRDDIREFWHEYFTRSGFPWESDGAPMHSPTHHLASWWPHRHEPNVLLLHYQDMLDDLDREMRRVSGFLGIPVDEALWPELVRACTFSAMKSAPQLDPVFSGKDTGSRKEFEFFHKGRNKQWQVFANDEDLDLHRRALASLPDDLRQWLARSG